DQLSHHGLHHVRRDREADADVAARAREDRRVDTDELAVQIDERATGVAGVDRRIGLDEVLVALRVDARAPERADDSRRHGVTETERVADRYNVIADLDLV